MTIRDILSPARTTVFWYGPGATKAVRRQLGDFRLSLVSSTTRLTRLANDTFVGALAAAIFIQSREKPLRVVDAIERSAANLLDHDVLVMIAADRRLNTVRNVLERIGLPAVVPNERGDGYEVLSNGVSSPFELGAAPLLPHVRVLNDAVSTALIIQSVLEHRAQTTIRPDLASVFSVVGPDANSATPKDRLLLRRGFWDCKEVHLIRLSDGHSSARVYLAHTTPAMPMMSLRPIPYFVKIGPREAITKEWRNYEQYVRQYFPYHLAPRLDSQRCALGAHMGIIVGDFVEDSEALTSCSVGGRAMTPVGTLFDRTLKGWHYRPAVETANLSAVMAKFYAEAPPANRLPAALAEGARRGADEMRRVLATQQDELLLCGRLHGDMHADNIRVRGSDAILIDFADSQRGPLMVDAAALEMGLAIRAPVNAAFDYTAWKQVMDELYALDSLREPPSGANPTDRYGPIAACIRQVRLHALPMQRRPGQYARVLAFHLYRSAVKDPDSGPAEESRRAYAYVLADRLLDYAW